MRGEAIDPFEGVHQLGGLEGRAVDGRGVGPITVSLSPAYSTGATVAGPPSPAGYTDVR